MEKSKNKSDQLLSVESEKLEKEKKKKKKKKEKEKGSIANFDLTIQKQIVVEDNGEIRERRLELAIKMNDDDPQIPFTIPCDQFHTRRLQTKILEVAGPSAIIYGSVKELAINAQEKSGQVPEILMQSHGLTPDGDYVSEGMEITRSGIKQSPDIHVNLGDGNFSRHLGFLTPDPKKVRQIGKHIVTHLLELKDHRVTYPFMGHISLAPIASVISSLGKEKPILHLEGASGGGKTFEGGLGMAFYGDFGEKVPSWTSTPNSLEAEGYWFKDSLFLIDDLKPGFTPQESVVRILQGYSGERGRSRLNSNSTQRKTFFIRGLLLTTGEGFIGDIESVTGRTICLKVEPEKNIKAGEQCKKFSRLYRSFTPGLIHSVISKPNWKDKTKEFVDKKTGALSRETRELSNGLRAASSWALNALGLEFFTTYLSELRVITQKKKEQIMNEHMEIAQNHLKEQMERLRGENPSEIFFRILGQKLQAGSISIEELEGMDSKGRSIGQVKDNAVLIFPDISLEVLAGHFHALEERMPFNRNSLRDALAQDGALHRPREGRWTKQVRDDKGTRHNAWKFELETFKKRIGVK